ncbi:MAG: DNA-directed RNA polymerase subunit alpha [Patescibacteria group bacterium]|jgi:DNA-directed RNA polymerase subunit alpha
MQNIALPKKIDFKKGSEPNQGIITVEPLFPGYGMTLGNSLRRVLLSSLPGAAVVGVKIKGASHEFMALPHVKEDVLELVLNLKQLRFKTFTDEEVRLDLKVKGKKTVTAGDITKNSLVDIKNPDLVLAHITEEGGSLEMEIFVHEGRGYRLAEETKKENREIGYIEIDSIFSPVILVSISVDNTRVGKMTNWDKLVLDVKTDGTISAEDAFTEAVKILVAQFSSLLEKGEIAEEAPAMPETADEAYIAEEEEETEEPSESVKKEKKEKKETKKKTKK